ncbi:acyltransferase family protein [Streptomyces sp. NBC_01478]|uniref:acyltransferase family protein n=1 Tax=Streptomyces sp. NBC_01478 TaxID=2903882 RepID=UPI002E36B445|nr:acyltransferase family protein [Streptomyces sp. NBC_01478]
MFHADTPPGQNEQSKQNEKSELAKPRDAFFDNAKYLAILLVAIGHSWEPLKGGDRALQGLYMVVYSFHMPAFIVISGYFSRSFDMSPARLKRLLTGVALPYILFEIAYSLFSRYANDDPHQRITLLDPLYLTWFLCALFIWRLTTPIWKLVRHPLPLALGIAMLASCTPDMTDDFDLQRLAQFLPYFVLGLVLRPEHFRWVRRRAVRVLSVPVFVSALAVGYWAVPRMNAGWFYHHDSAQEFGAPWWTGPVMMLLMFGCSLLLTAGFCSWVPGRRTWFTALGAGTLYGYLLHGFLIKGAGYAGLYDHAWLHRPYGVALVTALAATAVTLLCTPPVRRVFRSVIEPDMEWAFKRNAAEPARDRRQLERPAVREKVNA